MTTKKRDKKCIPIAKEVLRLIAAYGGSIGDVKQEDTVKEYEKLEISILKIYLDKELTSSEIDYVKQLVLQAVELPLNYVLASIVNSFDRATEKVWKKPFAEVTFKDINKILE